MYLGYPSVDVKLILFFSLFGWLTVGSSIFDDMISALFPGDSNRDSAMGNI
jgi:hypothetical protein